MLSAMFGAKNVFTHASSFKKIVGRHEFLDGQADRQLYSFIHIDYTLQL